MKRKLTNIIRTTFTETDGADIKHEQKVDKDSQIKMANAKKAWLMDYQEEREKKREYIRQNVTAVGLDESKLLKKMQDAKNSVIPSVDDFDMVALKNLVEELQHEYDQQKQNEGEGQIDSSTNPTGENGGSGDNSDAKSSMALFDKLQAKEDQELDDSVSSVRSSNSFRSVGTRKAKLTVLNQKAFSQIYVSDVYQLITSKLGKMVRGQSLMIVMTTYPMGWKVQRLDIDFVQLRNYLIRKYPQVIIPPLPLVNQKKKLSRKQLQKKKTYYQKFMTSVMKSKVLRGCKFLVDFLREQDQYKFGYDLSVKEQSRGPRRVKQIKTLTGEVLCEASDMAKQFSEDFNVFNTEYQRINGQISKRCKQVELMAKKLAYTYFGLSTELDNLQKLVLQKTEIPQFSNLYQRISDLVRMTGELSIHQGFMVNDALNAQFKYQREQGRTSFQEAFLLVQGSEFKFQRSQKLLEQEKYKLFKKQDYEQWEVQDPALIKELYKVRNNYEEAKHLMLPQRTQAVQELLDESQYFKQQLFNEVRRIIMLDYFSSRENFLEVGEQYVNHMGKNLKQWHQFIQFYSDINNARKEKDEQYRREQYVGEELDWKMLADNLTMFESQMEDLKDLHGPMDADMSILNQSIAVNQGGMGMMGGQSNEVPFEADNISMVHGYRSQNEPIQRSQSMTDRSGRGGTTNYGGQQMSNDDFKPHPSMMGGQNQFGNQQAMFNKQMTMPMAGRSSMRENRSNSLMQNNFNDNNMQEPLLGNFNNQMPNQMMGQGMDNMQGYNQMMGGMQQNNFNNFNNMNNNQQWMGNNMGNNMGGPNNFMQQNQMNMGGGSGMQQQMFNQQNNMQQQLNNNQAPQQVDSASPTPTTQATTTVTSNAEGSSEPAQNPGETSEAPKEPESAAAPQQVQTAPEAPEGTDEVKETTGEIPGEQPREDEPLITKEEDGKEGADNAD